MNRNPVFTQDLASLPTHGFGHRSLTWWGVLAFMAIEGAGFAMAIAAYFFLMGNEQNWPPEPIDPPGLIWSTLFTLLLVLSELPNAAIKKAAEKEQLGTVQMGLLLMSLVGLVLLVFRGFEFTTLNVKWTENAYGSVVWMLLVLHATHVLTDWIDTLVLTALMFTPHGKTGRRFADVSENSLYWRFVWLTWIPIYLLLYWVPRWVE